MHRSNPLVHKCTLRLSAVNVFNNSAGRVHSCTVQIHWCINAPYDIARSRMAPDHPVDVGSQGMCCWEPVWKRLVAKVFLMFRQRLAHSFGSALTDPGSVDARSLSECRSNCFSHFQIARGPLILSPEARACPGFSANFAENITIIANGRLRYAMNCDQSLVRLKASKVSKNFTLETFKPASIKNNFLLSIG